MSQKADPLTLSRLEIALFKCNCPCHRGHGLKHRQACCAKAPCGERVRRGRGIGKHSAFTNMELHVWNCLSCQGVLDDKQLAKLPESEKRMITLAEAIELDKQKK